MQPLSAVDALAPAFTRTHELLLSPFRWGRSWKLSASMYLGFCGSIFVPFPLFFALMPRSTFPGLINHRGLVVGAGMIVSLLLLLLFYLGARMELVNFEMVVTCAKKIAPMWRRYGSSVWPMLWTKVVLGTALTLALLHPLAVAFRAMFTLLEHMPHPVPGQIQTPAEVQAQMATMLHGMLPVYVVMYGSFFLLKFFSTMLNDFVVPFYLLEEMSLFSALRSGAKVIAADPLQVVLYLLMKVVLGVLGGIAYLVAFLIAEVLLLIPFCILFFIGVFAGMALTKAMGAAGVVLIGVAGVLLYLLFIVAVMYVNLGLFGYLITLLEAYGVYFLGGRYPRLGELLEPSAPPPFRYTPPPSMPSPEEDDSNDPPLPMDPAIA